MIDKKYSDLFLAAIERGDKAEAGRLVASLPELVRNMYGDEPLMHKLATEGCLVGVRLLTELGVDPDMVDATGDTPLHNAIVCGHGDLVNFLLARGADPNRADGGGFPPLYSAIVRGDVAIFDSLVAFGAMAELSSSSGIRAEDALDRCGGEIEAFVKRLKGACGPS